MTEILAPHGEINATMRSPVTTYTQCGIMPKVVNNQAAYIQLWLKRLENNRRWLIYAASKAQKATDFILGTDHGIDEADDQGSNTSSDV